jgi:C4-dicarboxylate transporter, DctM subunit
LAMLFYVAYVGLNLKSMKSVISSTVRTSCMILFIAVGAQIFSFSMVYSDLNQIMTTWVVSHGTTPETVFVLIVAIYIVLGCFLDPISIIVLSMGVLYPIVVQFHFDPIWFGVVLVIMVELGLITPPVGLNLFVIHGISGKRPMGEIISGAFPYCFLLLFGVMLLYFFPGIALFLPNSMR